MEKPYGSGHFGEWIEDEHGLPAYRYTCDQMCDPLAVTPVNPAWRAPTDHTHQVGNDRLVALASNYGYVQVRQDEGGPKLLNDYDPAHGHYGGGLGYLCDGKRLVSTLYPAARADSFLRILGAGYLRKTVTAGPYTVDQVLFAPYGDDPLLISRVTVTNGGDRPADLRWVEYWGCRHYPLSYRATLQSLLHKDMGRAAALRRRFAARFAHHFEPLPEGAGLLERKRFRGRSPGDRLSWAILQGLMATVARQSAGGPVRAHTPEARLDDLTPPPTFLVSLDAPADALSADAQSFFGIGGPERPVGMRSGLDGKLSGEALLLERRFHLEPGESRTLYLAYGYLPEGVDLEALLARTRQDLPTLWERSSAAWRTGGLRLSVPGAPWVERELTWHHYYLRSNLTYDDFFGEHILSQGNVYQYLMGFQGAARDPLQHALPFIYSDPQVVKEVLRYTLKEVQPDGTLPYGIVGHGMIMPGPFAPSDLQLWVLWLASEYVLATRDTAFLGEELPTYPLYGPHAGRDTVSNLLARCYRGLTETIGVGEHGLLRLSNGDWNDGAVIGHVPKESHAAVRRQAESVLNAAMAGYVLDLYARLLTYTGQAEAAEKARRFAAGQREAVRAQWATRWFRRAWLTPELGWLGDDPLWLEPQPWALISGAATAEQAQALTAAIDELARRPSPIGAMLLSRPIPAIEAAPGVLTNGGVWPSINGTLIWALAQVDGRLAWDEWQKNTLARHAEAYPGIWYGIWSGPDTYNSALSAQYAGQTFFEERRLKPGLPPQPEPGLFSGVDWTDFPIMNMHVHAWPLYSAARLLGVEFEPEGLTLAPSLPLAAYRFDSPLLGLHRSEAGYEGWYASAAAGEWRLTLRLPEGERARAHVLEVNGREQPWERDGEGSLVFRGLSRPGEPLRWALRLAP